MDALLLLYVASESLPNTRIGSRQPTGVKANRERHPLSSRSSIDSLVALDCSLSKLFFRNLA